MGSTEQKQYHFKENGGSRELILTGFKVKQDEVCVCTAFENAAFKANPIGYQFSSLGLNYTEEEIMQWAEDNGFDLFTGGEDLQGPYILSEAINAGKTEVTVTFNQNIDKTDDLTALKAAITIAEDGENFAALAGGDSVADIDGNSADLVITFASALTTATNVIKVAEGALVDADGNENNEETTGQIDATA